MKYHHHHTTPFFFKYGSDLGAAENLGRVYDSSQIYQGQRHDGEDDVIPPSAPPPKAH